MPLSPPTARRLGAVLTAIVGLMNVLSALYPAIPGRIHLLRDVLPVHLMRSSQTATVLTGFFLIVLADGLRKRRKRAMQITIGLLCASVIFNLTKGLDFEEATIAAALAFGLFHFRDAFDISGGPPAPLHLAQRISTFGLLYYCYVLLGFLVLRKAVWPAPTFSAVTFEPLRLLVDAPQYHYATAQAQWFQRSLSMVGGVALLYAVLLVLRPLVPRRMATPAERHRVREIVEAHGSDTLSYFALQDGRSYFFDPSGEAFLSYRLWRSVALVAGDPVGPSERIRDLVHAFMKFTSENALDVGFVGVNSVHLPLYYELGLRSLKIGEEALVDLESFTVDNLKRKVRRAARHAEDLGIRAQTYRRGDLPSTIAAQMHDISREWVKANGGAERGFSMTLGRIPGPEDADCEITVALEGDHVWGYLCMVPAYSGSAWSLDAMRRRSESPNGLMESLVIHAAETYRDRGFRTLSLNFATLSNSRDDIDSHALETTRRFMFEHLSSVYQLKSLQQFTGKFQPHWQSRYVAYGDVLKFPKLAVAIAQAEDPIRLPSPAALFRR